MIEVWAACWNLWAIALGVGPKPKPPGIVIPFRSKRKKRCKT